MICGVVSNGESARRIARQGICPLFSEDDCTELSRFCGTFDIRFDQIAHADVVAILRQPMCWSVGEADYSTSLPEASQPPYTRISELVGAVSLAAAEVAEVYAYLTGRIFIQLDDDPLLWPNTLAVIVGLVADFDVTTIGEISDRLGHGQCVSIVWGRTPRRLYLAAAKSAASLCVQVENKPLLVDLFPNADVSAISMESRLIVGSAGSGAIKQLKRAVPDVLHINSHGDGIDLQLPGYVLCGVKSAKSSFAVATSNLPCCVATNYCHRLKTDLDEALGSSETLSANSLFAKILVLDSCFSLVPAKSQVDNVWSILHWLTDTASIACTLATPDCVISSAFDRDHLLQGLMSGLTVGAATVASAAQDAPVEAMRHRFIVFGDSAFKPFAPEKKIEFGVQSGDFSKLRDKLEMTPAIKFLNQLDNSEFNLQQSYKRFMEHGWARLIEAALATSTSVRSYRNVSACSHCSAPTQILVGSSDDWADRSTLFCLRCGPIVCWPTSRVQPYLQLSQGEIHVRNLEIQDRWVGGAFRWGYQLEDMIAEDWRVNYEGAPESNHVFHKPSMVRHRREGAIFLDEDWFLMSYPQEYVFV